jgi:hypothetical protein
MAIAKRESEAAKIKLLVTMKKTNRVINDNMNTTDQANLTPISTSI